MSADQAIFVIESNDFAAQKLREALDLYGFADDVECVANVPDMANSAVIQPSSPLRIGRIIDQILHYKRESASGEEVIVFGDCRLDRYQGLFSKGDNAPVRLAEKEVALLVLLHESKGEAVSREVLLEQIWQYAENVETHTLETHIYRLRRKIEQDPAEPKILQTSDKGYFLSFE